MYKIILFISVLLFSSCLVTKKKYDEMNSKNQKKIDSLEYALDKTLFDYKNDTDKFNTLLNKNQNIIDSLKDITGKLSSDTSNLSNSLASALEEYNKKQRILKETENRLNKKSELINPKKPENKI